METIRNNSPAAAPNPINLNLIGEFFGRWWTTLRLQFSQWVDRWLQLIIDGFKGAVLQPSFIGRCVDLVTDLVVIFGSSFTYALADTVYDLARQLVPPSWGREVVTRRQATFDAIDLIWRSGVLGFQVTTLPGWVSLSDRMGEVDVMIDLAHRRLPRLLYLWKKAFAKLLKWWIRAILLVSRIGLVVALTWLTIRLLQLVQDKVLFRPLSQSNPRTTYRGPVSFRLRGTARRFASEENPEIVRPEATLARSAAPTIAPMSAQRPPSEKRVLGHFGTLKFLRRRENGVHVAPFLPLLLCGLLCGCLLDGGGNGGNDQPAGPSIPSAPTNRPPNPPPWPPPPHDFPRR